MTVITPDRRFAPWFKRGRLAAAAFALVAWGASNSAWAQEGAPTSDAPGEVTLQEKGYGWLLTDTKGMTLYTFTRDQEPGKSKCDEECALEWPPLNASGPANTEAKAGGDWSTLKRDDGSFQWAFRGKPLYTFSRDVAPGDANGDELRRQWYVATKAIAMPPGFTAFKTQHGQLLADLNDMTLYVSGADEPGKSACDAMCARTWRPVEAWWSAASSDGDWSVMTRDDGTKQWAYKSKPLYRYAGDFNPSDMAGNGIEAWSAVILEPPPPVPDWVTYQQSDGGELLADPEGRTMYGHVYVPGQPGRLPTAKNGMERPGDWNPVLAAPDAKPVGYWSIVTREDGTRQWARRGLLLYTNIRDEEAGDLNGVRSTDRIWRPIMTSGQTMAGTGV